MVAAGKSWKRSTVSWMTERLRTPEILAPAGDTQSFLSALAAGADAVYCGLKHLSARMKAENFSIAELAALTRLAHDQKAKVYIAMNVMLKPDDLAKAGRLLDRLTRSVGPDAVIIQDPAIVDLAKQTGFSGEVHFSTLANLSFSRSLATVAAGDLRVDRVILPRELDIDEIRAMAAACPETLGLELFVHGALCYGVSGRCYWSSFMGGKSGLRGRCVQPCRRMYRQERTSARFFSCLDLSLDVLARTLRSIPQITSWKIEGRKKGPHYVFYTVKAYQLLRDHPDDPRIKKDALELLGRALGRQGTHYHFLPQNPHNPIPTHDQTGSGILAGRTSGGPQGTFLRPRLPLLGGDLLRVGSEDEDGFHTMVKVRRAVPKSGRFDLPGRIPKGIPVILVDRREPELVQLLNQLGGKLESLKSPEPGLSGFTPRLPGPVRQKSRTMRMDVYRVPPRSAGKQQFGLWMSPDLVRTVSRTLFPRIWWWLPPVIWPSEEDRWAETITAARRKGSTSFVINQPWQAALVPHDRETVMWAGPFCNLANPLAFQAMAGLGCAGAVVSPELSGEDLLKLPGRSPIPLGIVLSGNWPLCISRVVSGDLKENQPFASPKGEEAWTRRIGANFWTFPNWLLDIGSRGPDLKQAGYTFFLHLKEPLPKSVSLKKRPGAWNWDQGLL